MLTLKERSARGGEVRRINSFECAESYRWFIEPLSRGSLSLSQMAKTMNAYRIATPTGVGAWEKMTVKRTLQRLGLYGQAAAC